MILQDISIHSIVRHSWIDSYSYHIHSFFSYTGCCQVDTRWTKDETNPRKQTKRNKRKRNSKRI